MTFPPNKTVVFLPWIGEFGWFVLFFIRKVYFCKNPKIVCCREGEEIYFPNTKKFYTNWKKPNDQFVDLIRGQRHYNHPTMKLLKKYFKVKYPKYFIYDYAADPQFCNINTSTHIPIKLEKQYGLHPDVVLAPRHKVKGARKNWEGWQIVVNGLRKKKVTCAVVGKKTTTHVLKNVLYNSWDFNHHNSASVEMIRNCKLFISPSTGPVWLAGNENKNVLWLMSKADWRKRMFQLNKGKTILLQEWQKNPELIVKTALNILKK